MRRPAVIVALVLVALLGQSVRTAPVLAADSFPRDPAAWAYAGTVTSTLTYTDDTGHWEVVTEYKLDPIPVSSTINHSNWTGGNALQSVAQGFWVRSTQTYHSETACLFPNPNRTVHDQPAYTTPWTYRTGAEGVFSIHWGSADSTDNYRFWGATVGLSYQDPAFAAPSTLTDCDGEQSIQPLSVAFSHHVRLTSDNSPLAALPNGPNSPVLTGSAEWLPGAEGYLARTTFSLERGSSARALLSGTMTGNYPSSHDALTKPALVSLGDSYQSGEGTFSYDPDTDRSESSIGKVENRCHRGFTSIGSQALGAFTQMPPDPERPVYNINLACSGAVGTNIMSTPFCGSGCSLNEQAKTQPDVTVFMEPAQYAQLARVRNAIGDALKVVTLGIGGNDAGFSDVVTMCVLPAVSCVETFEHAPSFTDGNARVQRAVDAATSVLDNVRNLVGPDVLIVLIGYPVFADNTWAVPDLDCPAGISDSEMVYIRGKILSLNRQYQQLAASRANTRYLSLDDVYNGHGVCQPEGQNRINKLVGVPPRPESFHPNQAGVVPTGDKLAACVVDAAACGTASGEPEVPLTALAKADLVGALDAFSGRFSGHVAGATAGSLVDVFLESTPSYLGSVLVGEGGFISADLSLPLGVPAGAHTLVLRTDAPPGSPALRLEARVPVTVPDTTAPTISLTSGPVPNARSTAAVFSFAGTEPERSEPELSFRCRLDGGAQQPCSSPASVTGLSQGTHAFEVRARDAAGNESPPATWSWRVDTLAPTISTGPLPAFTLSGTIAISYAGTDSGSGVSDYDVRYRRASSTGGFGSFVYPSTGSTDWQATAATRVVLPLVRGFTYCLSARTRDKAGNVSAWSPEQCTATPLDDRALSATSGWSRGTGAVYYAATVTSTAGQGQVLTRTSVQTKRIAVVATRCSSCGTLAIYWNGALIKQVSLRAATTAHKQVLAIVTFSGVRSGTLVLRTLSTGATRVDGVGLLRA